MTDDDTKPTPPSPQELAAAIELPEPPPLTPRQQLRRMVQRAIARVLGGTTVEIPPGVILPDREHIRALFRDSDDETIH